MEDTGLQLGPDQSATQLIIDGRSDTWTHTQASRRLQNGPAVCLRNLDPQRGLRKLGQMSSFSKKCPHGPMVSNSNWFSQRQLYKSTHSHTHTHIMVNDTGRHMSGLPDTLLQKFAEGKIEQGK